MNNTIKLRMEKTSLSLAVLALCASGLLISPVSGQVGRRFPSEKKIVTDSVTGTPLTFLTSTPAGDSKIFSALAATMSPSIWRRAPKLKGASVRVAWAPVPLASPA